MYLKMSTFHGTIKELENILVDNFTLYKTHTCLFLSHCHSDHMTGLDQFFSSTDEKSNIHIYCSPISRLILLNKYNIAFQNVIKELTSPKVITIPENEVAPSYQVTVTPIPAGHCPGSIMFLFETVNQRILYTGDFRISKNDLKNFKPLHIKNQVKLINKLYFDSTFLNEMYWDFPLRSEVADELVNLVKNWINLNPNYNVLLETSASYGYEYVFVELARRLKYKIHVKNSFYDLFWNVPEVGCFLTKDCEITQIHAFSTFDKKCLPLKDEGILRIKLSAQWYKCEKGSTDLPMWKKVSSRRVLMCYSTHCSCSELVNFLKYLQPESLEPCTTAVSSTEEDTREYIEQLILSWSLNKKKLSPQPVKPDFLLDNSYKFELKFPECDTKDFEDPVEFLPEKKTIKDGVKSLKENETKIECT